MRCEVESSPVVVNSIIVETIAGLPVYCDDATCSPSTSYSCVFANVGGDSLCGSFSDILYVNPLFCGGPVPDWSLEDCSPCIGAGEGGTTIGAGEVGCVCDDPTGLTGPTSQGVSLIACVPNPAIENVAVRFETERAEAPVVVSMYSAAGRLVRRLSARAGGSGRGSLNWDCRDMSGSRVASGVYFVQVSCGGSVDRGRVVILE